MPPDIRAAMGNWQFGTARALLSEAQGVLELRRQVENTAPDEGTTPPRTLQTVFETVGTDAALSEAQRELEALSSLSVARAARTDSKSATRAVGLLGTDPEADLTAARKAFAEGDIRKAVSLADSAKSAWTGATTVGQIRILGTAAGSAGVLLLIALYVWTRSGRRPEDGPAADQAGPAERQDA
jgi:hypothetical protein